MKKTIETDWSKRFEAPVDLADMPPTGRPSTASGRGGQCLRLTLPLRIVSELNMREHHMMRAKRSRIQRSLTRLIVSARFAAFNWPAPPIVVSLTRVAVRLFDDDNLAGGFKHIRDGIADILGINDGDRSKIVFEYQQRKASSKARTNEVEVEIAAEHWGARRMQNEKAGRADDATGHVENRNQKGTS